jgi:hypothetical protein
MSKRHIVRAPQTDRYAIDVPCKPADLNCSPIVLAGRPSSLIVESGATATLGGFTVTRDTESIVTSTSPFTVTPKHDGTYLVVFSSVLDIGTAFADRIIAYTVLVNGVSAASIPKAARVGGLHTEQIIANLRITAGQPVTFQVTNSAGGTVTFAAFQIDFINVGP